MSADFRDAAASRPILERHQNQDRESIAGAAPESLQGRTIVLDCRYLGMGGTGRVTELLLQEFRETPPPGHWVLWGRRDLIEPHRFAGADISATSTDPLSFIGQRSIAAIPKADVVIYLHQIRPLRPGASVTLIHDTIPLRYGGSRFSRELKRWFLVLAGRLSNHVLTDSPESKDSIHRDLTVPLDRITMVRFPVDHERGQRIWNLRKTIEQQETLLYVGRFDTHKNLERLCEAFSRSAFAAGGGRLLLVGGWDGEVEPLQRWVRDTGIGATEVRGKCSEEELDQLLASSKALIMPSLEEGYGLPAFEAAASGLPVAVSKTGAMTNLPGALAVQFDAEDVEAIQQAIDEVTARTPRDPAQFPPPFFAEAVLHAVGSAL